MKILILGGHGFIGHHTARDLTDRGHDVGVVDVYHQYGDYQDWEYWPVIEQRISFMGEHKLYRGDVADPVHRGHGLHVPAALLFAPLHVAW